MVSVRPYVRQLQKQNKTTRQRYMGPGGSLCNRQCFLLIALVSLSVNPSSFILKQIFPLKAYMARNDDAITILLMQHFMDSKYNCIIMEFTKGIRENRNS